jgi:protein phosphatase
LVQELVDAGQITEEEAEVHPNKNIITRSLGQTSEVQSDISVVELQAGDMLLMNSDGLTNMISAAEILEITHFEGLSMDQRTAALIQLANEHGGFDNITAILIGFDGEVLAEMQEVD